MLPIRYHLPGLRYNFPLNMLWVSLWRKYPHYFREGVEIGSVFGAFPLSLWNGGRFTGDDQCDARFVRMVVKAFGDEGIPVRYTYTNPLLDETDLRDPFCNFCMEVADNGKNEVLVFSPLLEEFIRMKYPSYAIDSTTCKEIKDVVALNAELARDYRYVVLDYNLNNQWALLEQIAHPEKLEILVNSCCTPACPRRGEHYRQIAVDQRTVLENRTLPPEKRKSVRPWRCEYGENAGIHVISKYPTFVSPALIETEYLPRGIHNFKIEGRTGNLFSLLETYCYYMIRPEHVGEVRLSILLNLEAQHVVTVNKPRAGKFP